MSHELVQDVTVVSAVSVCWMFLVSLVTSMGLFTPAFVELYNATRFEAAWPGSLHNGMFFLFSMGSAQIMEKLGFFLPMCGALVCMLVCLLTLTVSPKLWITYTLFGVMGLSASFILTGSATFNSLHFDKKRQLAFSVVAIISGVGAFGISFLIQWATNEQGYKGALYVYACLTLPAFLATSTFYFLPPRFHSNRNKDLHRSRSAESDTFKMEALDDPSTCTPPADPRLSADTHLSADEVENIHIEQLERAYHPEQLESRDTRARVTDTRARITEETQSESLQRNRQVSQCKSIGCIPCDENQHHNETSEKVAMIKSDSKATEGSLVEQEKVSSTGARCERSDLCCDKPTRFVLFLFVSSCLLTQGTIHSLFILTQDVATDFFNIAPERATLIFIFISAGNLVGRTLSVTFAIVPRINRPAVIAAMYLLYTVMAATLPHTNFWTACAFIFILGTIFGVYISTFATVNIDFFGDTNIPWYIGVAQTAGGVGVTTMPPIAGLIRDKYSYIEAYYFTAVCLFVGAVLYAILVMHPHSRKLRKEALKRLNKHQM